MLTLVPHPLPTLYSGHLGQGRGAGPRLGWLGPQARVLGRHPLSWAPLAKPVALVGHWVVRSPSGCSTPFGPCGPLYIRWVPLLDSSRTFRNLPVPYKYSGTFPIPPETLSLYESYSPDSSGTPRDVRDLIRNSESPFVHFII